MSSSLHARRMGTRTDGQNACALMLYKWLGHEMLYPDSGISMDEEFVLGDMIWSYNKAEL